MPWLIRRGGCPGCKLGCALTGSTDPNVLRLGQPCFFFFLRKCDLRKKKKKKMKCWRVRGAARAAGAAGFLFRLGSQCVGLFIYSFIYVFIILQRLTGWSAPRVQGLRVLDLVVRDSPIFIWMHFYCDLKNVPSFWYLKWEQNWKEKSIPLTQNVPNWGMFNN